MSHSFDLYIYIFRARRLAVVIVLGVVVVLMKTLAWNWRQKKMQMTYFIYHLIYSKSLLKSHWWDEGKKSVCVDICLGSWGMGVSEWVCLRFAYYDVLQQKLSGGVWETAVSICNTPRCVPALHRKSLAESCNWIITIFEVFRFTFYGKLECLRRTASSDTGAYRVSNK